MYSATFAITVIIGIAATNLFLGFAAAILLGRGPKSWGDIERAIVLHPVSLRGLRPAPRPKVERVDVKLKLAPVRMAPAPTPADPPSAAEPVDEPAPAVTKAGNGIELSPAVPEASATPTTPDTPNQSSEPSEKKFVIPSKSQNDEQENAPPEKTLGQQLESWRHGDLSDETPSMSGIRVDVDSAVDGAVRDALLGAVLAQIRQQVRRDRRVLELEDNLFAWFSSDVPPDDALMPVERIRQMLAKTRFIHQGETVDLALVAGVVVGLPDDEAEGLFERLGAALSHAAEKTEHATCLDIGMGPEGVEPYQIEVEETECEL